MKKILIIACTLFLALPLFAQENTITDNKDMISISAFMDVEMDIPVAAKNILKDRMTKAILKNGLSSTEGERFIMIAGVNELGKETTATALFKKYYAMDPVSQANKALKERKNSGEWSYVDLTKDDGNGIEEIDFPEELLGQVIEGTKIKFENEKYSIIS